MITMIPQAIEMIKFYDQKLHDRNEKGERKSVKIIIHFVRTTSSMIIGIDRKKSEKKVSFKVDKTGWTQR